MALAYPSLNTPRVNYSTLLLQTRIYGPIELSFTSLDEWHWSVCHSIQMKYLRFFFSAEAIASSFTAETYPWSTDLSGITTTRQLANFSKFFYGFPIGSFPTFKDPVKSLAKTPLKCLVSFLLTFQQAILNFQWVLGHAGIPGNKHADSLLNPLRWSLVPLPTYRQTRYTKYHKWTRHISTFPLPS